MADKSEAQKGQELRDRITNSLLEWATSDVISTKELQHFRFVGEIFHVTKVVAELCQSSGTIAGRQELATSVMLAALALAIDPEPPAKTQRQIDAAERRA